MHAVIWYVVILLLSTGSIDQDSRTSQRNYAMGQSDKIDIESHQCETSYPCKGMGKCIPEKDDQGQVTSDYSCQCYDQYLKKIGKENRECFKEVDHCSKNPGICKNGGNCHALWGNYFCSCKKGWGGIHCEDAFDRERMSTPDFIFEPDAFTSHAHWFVMYLRFPVTGDDLSFTISSNDGLSFSSNATWQYDSIAPLTNLFTSTAVRQHIKAEGKRPTRFFRFQHTFTAVDQDLKVYLYLGNAMKVQFYGSYSIRVNKDVTECVPFVTLFDCPPGNRDKMYFRRRETYIIRGRVARDCADYETELKYTWILYDVTLDNAPFDTGRWKNTMKYPVPQKSKYEFLIQPYTLWFGRYALRLKANEYIDNTKYRQRKSYFNSALCYFYISPEPLIVVIEGGSKRVVGHKLTLVVDGSRSFDPNEDASNQNTLKFEWSCEITSGTSTPLLCKGLNTVTHFGRTLQIPSYDLNPDSVLTFQLLIKNSFTNATATQVVNIVEGVTPVISIRYLENCADDFKSDTEEVTSFEVVCLSNCDKSETPGFYDWSQSEGPTNLDWNNDMQTEKDSHIVIIKQKVLSEGNQYEFAVSAGATNAKSEARVTIKTNKRPEKGTCKVRPDDGIAGFTTFIFNCKGFKDEDKWPLRYEIFQSQPSSAAEFGELLAYDILPDKTAILSRGTGPNSETTITIYVTDIYGMGTYVQLKVQAIEFAHAGFIHIIRMIIYGRSFALSIPSLIMGGDLSGAVRTISAVTDNIAVSDVPFEEKITFKRKLIEALNEAPLNRMPAIAQATMALQRIMSTNRLVLDYITVREALELLKQLSNGLHDTKITKDISTQEIRDTAEGILDVATTVMIAIFTKEEERKANATPPSFYDTYALYLDLTEEAIQKDKEMFVATQQVMGVVNEVGDTMMSRLVEGQEEEVIRSNLLLLWIKVDKPENFNKSFGDLEAGDYVSIPRALSSSLGSIPLGVQVVTSPNNPLWWQPSGSSINSHSIFLTLKNTATGRVIEKVPRSIDLYLQVNTTNVEPISGMFDIPRNNEGTLNLEDNIPIYQVDLDEGQTVFLNFSYDLPNKIKVLITQNLHPTPEDVSAKGVIIPKEDSNDPYFLTTPEIAVDDDAWFFIALIPLNITEAENDTDNQHYKMNFSFTAYTSRCQYWVPEKQIWDYTECHVGPMTTASSIHCRCTHMSLFTGSIFAPPNKLILIDDIPFYLKFSNNLNMMIFILVVLVVFLLAIFLAMFFDKRDKMTKRRVIILGDNSLNHKYAYLIAVYTGFRAHSGTTSTIGIQLKGTFINSEPHLLKSETIPIFKTGSQNWFVIYTSECLGEIQAIHVWHNSRGHRPPWYCNYVVVRDIQTKRRWVFLVERWLSLVKGGYSIQCTLEPATEEKLQSKRTLFLNNMYYYFREAHIWISLFRRNPQSLYSRCQRAAVLACSLSCATLFNIAFFGVPRENPAEQLDYGSYEFQGRNLLFGLLSAFVTVPPIFFLSFLFRKSVDVKDIKETPIQRKNISLQTYSDFENGRNLSPFQKIMFYAFPTDTLCSNHKSLEEVILGHEIDVSNSQQSSHRGELYMPFSLSPWTKYIAWVACIGLIILSCILTAIFGLNFGKVKSFQWMTSVSYIVYFSVMVVEPLKVITITLLSTFILKIHPFDMDLLRGYRLKPIFETRSTDEELVALRGQVEYKPIPTKKIPPNRAREKARNRMHGMFTDLLIFIVYAIMLYWLAQANRNSAGYGSTKNANNLFVDAKYHGRRLSSIKNNKTLIAYLRNTLIPCVHHEVDKNLKSIFENINGSSWTADANCQLLGVVRLRQLRVKPNNTCIQKSPVTEHLTCDPAYSFATSDDRNYFVAWKTQDDNSAYPEKAKLPWKYQDSLETGAFFSIGEFAYYSGGGYIAELGRSQNNSLLVIDFLENTKWFDQLTRFIAIEFTIYNVNVRLFNVITLIIEIESSGLYKTSSTVKTVTLIFDLDSTQINLLFACIFFLCISCFFVYQQLSSIQRLSFKEHFRELWNVIDLVLCSLAFTSVGIFFLRNVYVSSLLQNLQNTAHNKFVSFYGACVVDITLTYLMAFLVCASTMRFWRILRFSNQFQVFERTLRSAMISIMGLVFMLLITAAAFAGFTYLALGSHSNSFNGVIRSAVTLISMAIGINEYIDFQTLHDINPLFGPLFYAIFSIVSIIYLMNMFTTIIMEYYNTAQEDTSSGILHSYSLFHYLRDEFNFHFKRKEKPMEKWEQRLRGGADFSPETHNRKTKISSNRGKFSSSIARYFYPMLQQIARVETSTSLLKETLVDQENHETNHMDLQNEMYQTLASYQILSHYNNRTHNFQEKKVGILKLKEMFINENLNASMNYKSNLKQRMNWGDKNFISNDLSKSSNNIELKLSTKNFLSNEKKDIENLEKKLAILNETMSKLVFITSCNVQKLKKLRQQKNL